MQFYPDLIIAYIHLTFVYILFKKVVRLTALSCWHENLPMWIKHDMKTFLCELMFQGWGLLKLRSLISP